MSNFVKIGHTVEKLLAFLFPIEMHGVGGFLTILGVNFFVENVVALDR
jgi:hypothetical protein